MKQQHKKKPKLHRDIAIERIQELFNQAELRFKKSPELANRYVYIARKIAMKFKVKIPKELKRRFCKHCYNYMVPSVNCRVRLTQKKVVYSCLNCKKFMRFPYKIKKSLKKSSKKNTSK